MSRVYSQERQTGAGHADGTAWDGCFGAVWVKDAMVWVKDCHVWMEDGNFLAATSPQEEIQERSKRGMKDNWMRVVLRRGGLRYFCSLKSTGYLLISAANEPISASPNAAFGGAKGVRREVREEECVQQGDVPWDDDF